jgi:hypothetical protein
MDAFVDGAGRIRACQRALLSAEQSAQASDDAGARASSNNSSRAS